MKPILSNRLKDQISKIFWITVGWIVISVFQFLTGYSTLLNFNCDLKGQDPMVFFKGSILTGLLAGLLGGCLIVLLWERWLRSKKYSVALFRIFWSYLLIYSLVSAGTGFYLQSQDLDATLFESATQPTLLRFIELGALQNFIFWLLVVLATMIILLVNDKYGPGVFRSFLLGKYFQPKKEERIFMFLDLRSSTTIAEKLGEERYFNFIKDVFRDATPAILYAKGEIYQYVGDEIVVSWKMHHGIQKANCVQCFYEIQLALRLRHDYYQKLYDGITPEFKAGLHYGNVMAGEIGVVKRDIAFSGDVLNTTARIQAKCNELGVNLLLSGSILNKLNLHPNRYAPQKLGDVQLRGKNQKVILYTL